MTVESSDVRIRLAALNGVAEGAEQAALRAAQRAREARQEAKQQTDLVLSALGYDVSEPWTIDLLTGEVTKQGENGHES